MRKKVALGLALLVGVALLVWTCVYYFISAPAFRASVRPFVKTPFEASFAAEGGLADRRGLWYALFGNNGEQLTDYAYEKIFRLSDRYVALERDGSVDIYDLSENCTVLEQAQQVRVLQPGGEPLVFACCEGQWQAVGLRLPYAEEISLLGEYVQIQSGGAYTLYDARGQRAGASYDEPYVAVEESFSVTRGNTGMLCLRFHSGAEVLATAYEFVGENWLYIHHPSGQGQLYDKQGWLLMDTVEWADGRLLWTDERFDPPATVFMRDGEAFYLTEEGIQLLTFDEQICTYLLNGETVLEPLRPYRVRWNTEAGTAVRTAEGWQLVQGEGITPLPWQTLYRPADSRYFIGGAEGFFLLDLSLRPLHGEPFQAVAEADYRFAVVQQQSLWGVLQSDGTWLLEPVYTDVTPLTQGFLVQQEGLYGLVDKKGKILADCEYESLSALTEGLWVYEKEGRFGLLDGQKGGLITPNEYDLFFVRGQLVLALKHQRLTLFDLQGKLLEKYGYEYPEECARVNGQCKALEDNGLLAVCENGLWGVVDTRNGRQVFACAYTLLSVPGEGNPAGWLVASRDGSFCLLDLRKREESPLPACMNPRLIAQWPAE
ncbi:MAG: WG repeat-containing protein [Clostridia bacterium]|nr:WG repeat-containing protein [Clostridia bacterium]